MGVLVVPKKSHKDNLGSNDVRRKLVNNGQKNQQTCEELQISYLSPVKLSIGHQILEKMMSLDQSLSYLYTNLDIGSHMHIHHKCGGKRISRAHVYKQE